MSNDANFKKLKDLAFKKDQEGEAWDLAVTMRGSDSIAERSLALQVIAKRLFDQKKYAESLQAWKELSALTEDAGIWLSVVTTAIMAKDFSIADAYYSQAEQRILRYLHDKKSLEAPFPTPVYLMFYYAAASIDVGEAVRALDKIDTLAQNYGEHVLTDATHLYCAGAPSFTSFLQLIEQAYPSTKSSPVWSRVFPNLAKVDDEGQENLKETKARLGL
jgi:hypothetical protein